MVGARPSLDPEQSLLGSILVNPAAFDEVADIFNIDDIPHGHDLSMKKEFIMKKFDLGSLIGTCRKPTYLGNVRIDPDELLQPFESSKSAFYYFCKGCGCLFEIDKNVAEKIARDSGITLPKKITKMMYFETDGCDVCDGGSKKATFKKHILN